MAREPFLNFDELLAPIPGDDPAGSASAFRELRSEFEEMRREVTPEESAVTKDDVKDADWRGLERRAKETLTDTSKDLRIGGYLLETLVKLQGFAGGHDGLKLLRLMVEQCWDRLNPPLDPEDAEARAGPFYWMDDPDRGLLFPRTIRLTPLVVGENRSFSYEECRPQEQGAAAQALRVEAEHAIERASVEQLVATRDEVVGCLTELRALTEGLTAKMGDASPAMTAVRTVLEDCRTFLDQIIQKRPGGDDKADTVTKDGAPTPAGGGGGISPGASRAEIYRQIGVAALALKAIEPHSPIPYLLLRAVELGQMPFPLLMQELVRDANSLTELKREFGIKDAPPPSG